MSLNLVVSLEKKREEKEIEEINNKISFLHRKMMNKVHGSMEEISQLRTFLVLTEEKWGEEEMRRVWKETPRISKENLLREVGELKNEIERMERQIKIISN